MEPHEKSKRPLYLPPLSSSPYFQRKKKIRKQEGKEYKIPAEKMNQSPPSNKPMRGPESVTSSMNDPQQQRRNSICVMLMPAEYFAALPHLELLNVS
ncbi:hypothetical protein ACROYT_G003110 [Oculina patagonica]